ncbi:ferritin [candidate division KSB1 bacterium]|nr:ferritin [candidate division KSB1 bacterium]
MLSEKMKNLMNTQIKNELESAYLYLSMAAYFESDGWDGMSSWMKVQAQEEVNHAMKFYAHLQERDSRVKLAGLAEPKFEWKSPLDAFKAAYAHEQFITGTINNLMKLAVEESDYAAQGLLQWFVNEQVEEEASALKVVQMLERVGDSGNGLVMLDHKLGERGK